jgi:hypothetical protein
MPRLSEILKSLLTNPVQFDQRQVTEMGRRLDNIDGQTDGSAQSGSGSSGSGGAPASAPYITASAVAGLSFERTLVGTAPITATDNGANSTLAIGITAATHADPGAMSAADKTNLDELVAASFVLGSGVHKISVGTSAPGSPSAGDLWVDTT